MNRLRRSALAVLAASALVATGAPLPQASAHPSPPKVHLTPLGTYNTGAFDEGAPRSWRTTPAHRAFSVNAQAGTVDVLDISDPSAPPGSARWPPPAPTCRGAGTTIAVAEQATDKTDRGTVALFDAAT